MKKPAVRSFAAQYTDHGGGTGTWKYKKQIHIPLVADIHFDYRLAIAAIENGADKIRINPGNIGSRERVQAVVDKAKRIWGAYPCRCEQWLSGKRTGRKIW